MTDARWESLARHRRFLVDPDDIEGTPLDLDRLFGRAAPRVLDVGFGHGESTLALAADPGVDVLAVEVHTPGVADLLDRLAADGKDNARVVEGDVVPLLDRFADGSFRLVQVLFPDPWPKTRHHGRRLVRAPFVARITDLLAPGGILHVATDSPSYAATAAGAVEAEHRLRTHAGDRRDRPVTRFEARARRAGRPVHEIAAVRC